METKPTQLSIAGKTVDLSVVIVSFHTRELLRECLRSVFAGSAALSIEVFVVDNASGDGSPAMVSKDFPQVHLIANQVNVGFSTANNQALRRAQGRYVLLLNSDTVVGKDSFVRSIDYLSEHTEVGALTCRVLLPSGKLDLACRRSFPTPLTALWKLTGLSRIFPHSRFFARYNLTYLDENQTYEVEAIVGAFMLFPRETLLEVGMLDEQFFMYGEDLDWCYRVRQAGKQIVYFAGTSIMHHKGASSDKRRPFKMVKEFHRAMDLFYGKYYARRHFIFINLFIRMGVWLHFVSELLTSVAYSLRKRIVKLIPIHHLKTS